MNTVVLLRDGQELTFTVTMRQVYSPYVTYNMLDGNIGYIYISAFHGQCVREVEEALEDLRAQGMEALVLDVRDDLGGSFSDVRDIADLFLPKNSVITSVKSRVNKEIVYRTHSDGIDLPIAMLVNGYSASASELLSGALKDNGVAELFGTVTYGKGIVQTFLENLWHPGLTLTEPEVTRRLLSGVRYRNKGILLDTGHLMHTDLSLRTQEEALKYLYRRVEEQGEEVRKAIRGIHLHQSLTGAYMAAVAAHPPILFIDPIKRMEQVYTHAFTCDQHRPFTCPGVREFIRWIDPEYLTLEFISSSRMEQETMLKEQLASLEKP